MLIPSNQCGFLYNKRGIIAIFHHFISAHASLGVEALFSHTLMLNFVVFKLIGSVVIMDPIRGAYGVVVNRIEYFHQISTIIFKGESK